MTEKKKKDKKWIQGAIKNPGAFTAKAKRAKKTVKQYTKSVLKKGSKSTEKTKRQARLAKTLARISKGNQK